MIAQLFDRFTPERSINLALYLAELVDWLEGQVELAEEDGWLMLWVSHLLRTPRHWFLLAVTGDTAWGRVHSLERPNLRDPLSYDLLARDSRQSRRQAASIAALKAAAYSACAMSVLCKYSTGRHSQVARLIEDAIEASAAAAAASNAAFLGEKLEAALSPLED